MVKTCEYLVIEGTATKGVESVAASMKEGIKCALKRGLSIRQLEIATVAYWGNDVWRLKNVGRDKHKWLMVRDSDGIAYPITI